MASRIAVDAQELRHFQLPPLRLRPRQVDLVDHRDDLQVRIQREEEVGERLRLDALGGVHHQDGALARRQGA
jgi:hypothetical protein